MRRVLAYRFSALGDVVLAYPVLKAVLEANPNLEIVFATRAKFAGLFQGVDRLKVVGVDFESEHRGFWGVFKLFWKLRQLKPSAVADLHLILRSRILDALFALFFFKVAAIQKDRKSKKRLVRRENKILRPLEHSTVRYMKVFKALGFSTPELLPKVVFEPQAHAIEEVEKFLCTKNLRKCEKVWLGIAPFAQHENKIWGLEKVKQLIGLLMEEGRFEVFLFGGGKKEKALLDDLCLTFPESVHNVSMLFDLQGEMALMKQLDRFLAMDSANMHLASLAGTEVFSIWGATHPFAGFGPINQPEGRMIFTNMQCRPCSVFGDRPCFRGDRACLEGISAAFVAKKLMS